MNKPSAKPRWITLNPNTTLIVRNWNAVFIRVW